MNNITYEEALTNLIQEIQARKPVSDEDAHKQAEKILSVGCLYAPHGVTCTNKNNCFDCGFNPNVAKDRINRRFKQNKEEYLEA